MPVPQRFRDAAYPRDSDEATVFLIEIDHPDLDATIRLTDAAEDIVIGADTYVSAPIEVIPPGQSEEEPTGRIRVPNVDQRIGEGLDLITSPALVTISAVLESDPSVVIGGPHSLLRLQNIEGDALVVQGELTRQPITTAAWPKNWIRPGKFRAAFRT